MVHFGSSTRVWLELSSSGSEYHISLIFRHAKQVQKPLEGVQAASLPQMEARMFLSILTGSHMTTGRYYEALVTKPLKSALWSHIRLVPLPFFVCLSLSLFVLFSSVIELKKIKSNHQGNSMFSFHCSFVCSFLASGLY